MPGKIEAVPLGMDRKEASKGGKEVSPATLVGLNNSLAVRGSTFSADCRMHVFR